MHSNLSVTDGVYGILSEGDVKREIITIGEKIVTSENRSMDAMILLLESILSQLKNDQL